MLEAMSAQSRLIWRLFIQFKGLCSCQQCNEINIRVAHSMEFISLSYVINMNLLICFHLSVIQYKDANLPAQKSHCGNKMILSLSYLDNGISNTDDFYISNQGPVDYVMSGTWQHENHTHDESIYFSWKQTMDLTYRSLLSVKHRLSLST